MTALPSYARGLAHQLAQNFGSLDRDPLDLPEKLGPILRALKPFGVWLGRRSLYLPRLLRPDAASLLALLWGVWTKQQNLVGPPAPGLTSFARHAEPEAFLQAAGFRVFAGRAIRLDMLERLEDELDKAATAGLGAEAMLPRVTSLLGCGNDEARAVLAALGWRIVTAANAPAVWRKPRPRRRPRPRPAAPSSNSPFAGLAQLVK
jgi:ATP-dependent RNA helicase SUPV3L1/SUV3